MAKNKFNFKEVEEKWKKFWEKENLYRVDTSKNKIYSVDTPPPTVSGKMHLGHAFSYSQQDFIARFMRMFLAGKGSVFYPFGTDDNGLPTERLVEKENSIKSKEMSREDFIKVCLKTLKKIIPDFVNGWKNIGMSCDFNTSYSTIDDNSRKISQSSFIDFYKKNDIYKRDFPTIWCPDCRTSIAQAELEDNEEKSLFSTLKFSVSETKEDLFIATTRPELLEACVAVFVHPDDERYKKMVGKKANVPLFDFEVPIISDKSADPEKGTGVLMICSYGDKFDVDAINRHGLEPRVILDDNARIKEGKYKGLKVNEARKKILDDLDTSGLISEQKEVDHVVNVHDKCGTPIEFIPTKQWFIKILDKKKELIQQGNKVKWYPEFMHKRYENWVNGLEWDWSISRNRHFGVPIPVWECEECNEIILPSEDELPVDPLEKEKKCSKCGKNAEPEKMVLDTWATSSLTPQIASSLTGDKVSIPFSLRPNAHDIIRTWAFYTIVKSYLHEGKIPWEDIIISGVVSLGGEKMSKSKGNVVSPEEVLEKYGADAMRFWAAGSKLGNDLDYQEKDLVTGKKLINKLNNASKFVFMNLEDYSPGKEKPEELEAIDEVFLNKVNNLILKCTEAFENYEYAQAKNLVEQFFWGDFADNYIEIVKKRVYQGEGDARLSGQYALYRTLLSIVKIFAPIMPFITEEIYQTYFKEKGEKANSIHISSWPEAIKLSEKKYSEGMWEDFTELLSKIRQEKSNNQKPMNSEIILSLNKEDMSKFKDVLEDLKNVTNASEIKEGEFKVDFPSK